MKDEVILTKTVCDFPAGTVVEVQETLSNGSLLIRAGNIQTVVRSDEVKALEEDDNG